jgi:thiol-disulfide isomerase/thioredoxin
VNMKTIQETQFEKAIEKGKVIVMLAFEEKCKTCEEMKPMFEKFAKENVDIDCYLINYKFSLPAKPEGVLIDKFNIGTFPTFITVESGKILTQMKGNADPELLKTPFLSVLELKGKAYDCINVIKSIDKVEKNLELFNALVALKENTVPVETAGEDNVPPTGFNCCE